MVKEEKTTIRISKKLRDKAKIKATILRIDLEKYIERLIEINTKNIFLKGEKNET